MKIGINSVDDLGRLGVSSIDDLAKVGINNVDDLAKLGIEPSDLKKIGIDEDIFKGVGNPEAHNVVNYMKLKEQYKVTELGNDVVESLRTTGKLPSEYITEQEALNAGWKRGKALNNYAPGKKYGGDIFKNDTKVLPDAQGRVWYEADVGLDYTRGRNNNPGYRILYSNDGLIYGTYYHYESVFKIGTYK